MSGAMQALDPDVFEVLLDVAKDPRSKLFRWDVPKESYRVGQSLEEFPAEALTSSPSERHLLSCYREVMAERLVELAKSLLAGPTPRVLFANQEVGTEEAREAQLQRLAKSNALGNLPVPEVSWPALLGMRSSTDLSAAAYMLRPDLRTANIHAAVLVANGEPRKARGLLVRVLERSLDPAQRGVAALNMAVVGYELGARGEEILDCRLRSLAELPAPETAISALVTAAEMNDMQTARLLSQIVESPDHDLERVQWTQDALGRFTWPDSSIANFHRAIDELGGMSARIIHASIS